MNYIKTLIAFFTFMVCPRLYATMKSDQVTKIDSVDYDMLKPNEAHGRVRMAFGSVTTLASGGADGDIYQLFEIPKGARVLGGQIVVEAMGASVVAKVGITGDDDKYGSALDVAAAGKDEIGHTIAFNYGVETTAKERVFVTLTGAAPAASKKLYGHLFYVVD